MTYYPLPRLVRGGGGYDLHFQMYPVFKNAVPFCNIWMELIHPFKNYQTETKSVTMLTTLTETWSLCVDYTSQPTQKTLNRLHICIVLLFYYSLCCSLTETFHSKFATGQISIVHLVGWLTWLENPKTSFSCWSTTIT